MGYSGVFLLIGSKCCQCFLFFFFSPSGNSSAALTAFGSKSYGGKPAARLYLQQDPLSTISGHDALLFRTPAVVQRGEGPVQVLG